jgi:hypothetical protein
VKKKKYLPFSKLSHNDKHKDMLLGCDVMYSGKAYRRFRGTLHMTAAQYSETLRPKSYSLENVKPLISLFSTPQCPDHL